MPKTQEQAAFYLETAPLEWPVTVTIPVNGGEFEKFRFTGHFARLSGEQLDELTGIKSWKTRLEDAAKPPAPDQPEALDAETRSRQAVARMEALDAEMRAHQIAIIPDILIGWAGVLTAPGGQEVPFSAAVLTASLKGATGRALVDGIFGAVSEIRNGHRLGNSVPLPAAGQKPEPAEAPAAE